MTKTVFCSIVGRPNVGKSTIINALVGQKVAIVSKKPQTTRNCITGIVNKEETQLVFVDTPGMHLPKTKLGEFMVRSVKEALTDIDCIMLIVEPTDIIHKIEENLISNLESSNLPSILVINKIDTTNKEAIAKAIVTYTEHHTFDAVIPVSAKKGIAIDRVINEVEKFSKPSPWFFLDDEYTDQPEKVLVAELLREKALRLLDKEVPHGIAVDIISFKEDEEKGIIRIQANIFVEKESHKGIVIGKGGEMLKKIGSYARVDLEEMFGCKIHLELWVKVKEGWRDNNFILGDLGYKHQ